MALKKISTAAPLGAPLTSFPRFSLFEGAMWHVVKASHGIGIQ
jgi:hypothetical protein